MRRVCRPLDGKSMTETPALVRALVDHVTTVGRFDLGTWCNFKRQHQGRGTPVEPVLVEVIGQILLLTNEQQQGNGTAGGGAGGCNPAICVCRADRGPRLARKLDSPQQDRRSQLARAAFRHFVLPRWCYGLPICWAIVLGWVIYSCTLRDNCP